MIPIPDSVAFYWADEINRTALNVLVGAAEVPLDLTLPEAERFELAHLAARRVRVEHWTLLRALWSATWGEAVRLQYPRARLLTYGEHRGLVDQTDHLADPSLDLAWTEGAVCGVFALPEGAYLFTWFRLSEDGRDGDLRFYHWNASGSAAVSTALDLGADWTDDGSERRMTHPGLLLVDRRDDSIDPEPFAELARGAVCALAAALLNMP